MKATISRTTLALASMLVCLGSAQAEELSYSELETRLARIESQLATQSGLQQAAYCDGCCESSCCCDNGCCGDGCCDSGCCDSGCCDSCGTGCCDCCSSCGGGGGVYAQVEMMFIRAHIMEDSGFFPGPGAVGTQTAKLSEEYELAPRFVIGGESCNGLGARVRYWHYGHHQSYVDNVPVDIDGGLRTEIDVFDIEATQRLQFRRTDVTFGAGLRFASLDFSWDGITDSVDLFGGTIAADIETLICCRCDSYFSAIYGARMSILGGDWDFGSGQPAHKGAAPFSRDDNVVAQEMYGGVEYGCCYNGMDIYTQLKFEIQNWHSDVLSAWYGTDSVGFVGPGFVFGIGY